MGSTTKRKLHSTRAARPPSTVESDSLRWPPYLIKKRYETMITVPYLMVIWSLSQLIGTRISVGWLPSHDARKGSAAPWTYHAIPLSRARVLLII